MAFPPSKSFESALVLLVPDSLQSSIQAVRKKHDKAYQRWMPHVNLLYPFINDDATNFAEAANTIAQTLADIQPFQLTLKEFKYFEQGTMWLNPEASLLPAAAAGMAEIKQVDLEHRSKDQVEQENALVTQSVHRLQAKLEQLFPHCNDLSSDHGFAPHLSVGQWKPLSSLQQAQRDLQKNWKPIQFTVDSVFLISRSKIGPFTAKYQIRFGGAGIVKTPFPTNAASMGAEEQKHNKKRSRRDKTPQRLKELPMPQSTQEAMKRLCVIPNSITLTPTPTPTSPTTVNSSKTEKKDLACSIPPKVAKKASVMTTTENGCTAYGSTKSALLDLFFGAMVRQAPKEKVESLMNASWAEDPESTVQIVMNARDCRHGKGEKLVAYYALMWLRINKPKTYLLNLHRFVELGYYKDLLQIATLVITQHHPLLSAGHNEPVELEVLAERLARDRVLLLEYSERKDQKKAKLKLKKKAKRAVRKAEAAQIIQSELKADASATADAAKPDEVAQHKEEDHDHDIVQIEQVNASEKSQVPGTVADSNPAKEDTSALPKSGKSSFIKPRESVSLAAKWAPTEKCAFDKKAHLAHRTARVMFPGARDADRQYRVLLSGLREHLRVTERLMCDNEWEKINFSHVPSKAHHLLKKVFAKHQPERYQLYLSELKTGKAKINTTGLQPHELVSQYLCRRLSAVDDTVEMQWKSLLDKLKEAGRLRNSLSVCDVSGSMNGVPMQVAIALGIVTAKLTKGAFHNKCITFSENPTWHELQGDSLMEQVQGMKAMDWGYSTNLMSVFHLILDMAVSYEVPEKDMPRTLFIYSDMQFNAAASGFTAFNEVRQMYQEAKYQMPQIVFWNLCGDTQNFPVEIDANGVALMSGFSAELLKLFLEAEEFTPLMILKMALSKYDAEIDPSEI